LVAVEKKEGKSLRKEFATTKPNEFIFQKYFGRIKWMSAESLQISLPGDESPTFVLSDLEPTAAK
jgi:hypothetical protein